MDRISNVALLNSLSLVNLHGSLLATDFFDRKFDSSNFKNIAILNFVIYFFVVVFQTTHYKVHILVVCYQVSPVLLSFIENGTLFRSAISSRLKVESIVLINYFK